ncbi:hypothetical protein ACOTWC_06055 [Aliarcobacter butzleri]
MNVMIQPFEDLNCDEIIKPDKYFLLDKEAINISDDYIISRDYEGKVLSYYNDDIWDFSLLSSGGKRNIIFSKIKDIKYRKEIKRIVFLFILFKEGKKGSSLSVKTLNEYYSSGLIPLMIFSMSLNLSISDVLSNTKYINRYIKEFCINKSRAKVFLSILIFLDSLDNCFTNINYKKDNNTFLKLQDLRYRKFGDEKQTEVIPTDIFCNSLILRWEQISELEKNLNNLLKFIEFYINDRILSPSKKIYKSNSYNLEWKKTVINLRLNSLFDKYDIHNKSSISSFVLKIQGTCKNLIHAYSGMRHNEVLSLKNNCIEKLNSSTRLIGVTSKLEGKLVDAKWVTTKDIERVINLLKSINQLLASRFNLDINQLPLFIRSSFLSPKKKYNKSIYEHTLISNKSYLPLNDSINIKESDINELEYIEYDRDWRNDENFKVGKEWIFKSHQYRRSLSVYALNSSLVSIGSLQKQFKHLFKDMTYYYSNGAENAKKLFKISDDHIANDIEKIKPEIIALKFMKDVFFSDEESFGGYGSFVEKNLKKQIKDKNIYFLENREKTIKMFKKGEISYKESAVGGCFSNEECSFRMTRSFIECFVCNSSIIKKSKVKMVIENQEFFLDTLEPNSVDYKNELYDLNLLKEELKKM